ncbi:hypothetical protein [Glutamicibacter protophormiae]|uniref:hypothetical protein n=1 Tax=Glutamicibacter protophormiae TaxID=37930 RepID=UPI0019560F06|nr:hypothetical protein [Glutamicibacter protophormiae]QRQ79154.1 hypothetical protein JQN66_02555 [Glutamicibacter protophormiae]
MARKDTRLFARLDLDYADHPKIIVLSDAAFRAHIEMILYARKHMTDGRIPKQIAKRLGSESLSELLANDPETPSLIENEDGSYTLHGYADMNETKAEITARSRANAENGRRGGIAKKRNAKQTASESLSEPPSENVAETETETETELKDKAKVADAPVRPEILELLDHLDHQIIANGARKPNRTKTNLDAMRLLVDSDKRTVEEVHQAIDWATSNSFWKTHILNAKKLREKFDTMRLQASTPQNGSRQTERMRSGFDAMAGYNPTTIDPWAGRELTQ